MLFPIFASPRKVALFAALIFVVIILYLQSGPYQDRLPKFPAPNSGSGSEDHQSKFGTGQGTQPGLVGEGNSQNPDDLDRPANAAPVDKEHDNVHPDWLQSAGASQGYAESAYPGSKTRASIAPHSPSHTVPSTQVQIHTRPTVQHTFKTLSHDAPSAISSKVQALLAQWTPPVWPQHWPSYEWYGTKMAYDPNRWEGFEWDNDYYVKNGVKKMKKQHAAAATPTPYLPYPEYNSAKWKSEWQGTFKHCKGPRGKVLNKSPEDMVLAYPAVLDGFPNPSIGDANATGIDLDHCFDRYNRFGAYGFGQDEKKKIFDWKQKSVKPEWNYVDWGELQDRCMLDNKDRYGPNARQPFNRQPSKDLPKDHKKLPKHDSSPTPGAKHHARTAVLIRSWEGYVYTSNDIEAIRALIAELNLLSGGEYQVFLFVNVKDKFADIYSNDRVYNDMLEQHVPRELQGISILWNEAMLEKWYPKVGDWQVYWQQFMSLQWFSKQYPEFDYVWNWETDARYTGNHYHFLERMREFAKAQPRKYLWERNARYYIPSAHGSYEAWLDDTHASIQKAEKAKKLEPVWGALPYNATIQNPIGPVPPHAMNTDDFEWGVDEEADLITLQPIWDPTHTQWTMRDKIWNYLPGIRPHFTSKSPVDPGFTHPDFVNIPRRAYINTLSRFSRRQLHAMHLENLAGRSMQAEMWPATVALQHGLKAVYAPHPIWTDRKWPEWYMDAVFNANGGEDAQWNARSDSVYNHDREHNFAGWSWYYASDFPRILYRRWLGWSANIGDERQYPNNPLLSLGGEEFEEKGVKVTFPPATPDGSQAAPAGGESFGGREVVVGGMGRMCLPPMLLHPIKKVYRGAEEEGR